MLEEDEPPEMPEILVLQRQARLLGIPLYDGSLYDMPYILYHELLTVAEAEAEHQQRKLANQELFLKYEAAKSNVQQ